MKENEIQTFVKKYSDEDFQMIEFDWNGKHGDDFEDSNYDFRMKVCETIKSDFSYSSDKLILDLYLELSKCAKETWSVYNSYHLFANELLMRGGSKYFDKYIEGASKSMDTGISSGRLNLSKERIFEILNHIESKISNSENEADVVGYHHMLKRFKGMSEREEKKNKTQTNAKVGSERNSFWLWIKRKFNL